MDYKLEALHKQYKRYIRDHTINTWTTAVVAFFMLAFAIIAGIFELSIWYDVVTLFLFALCIISLVILLIGNEGDKEYIPLEVRKAEQEYQRELLKIKLEKQLKEEQAQKEFEDKLRAEMAKMNAHVKAVDYIIANMDALKALIDGTKQKQSTLDKKLSGKKK